MGVLNISDHLKHRIKITEENIGDSTWEESELTNELPDEPTEPIRSIRHRKPKLRPEYYLKTASCKPKGSRSGRRYENTCFLLSLVDHEEMQELDLSDIVNQTMTIFSALFEDPQKMKIWSDYTSLPEEEQYEYIHPNTANHESTATCVTEDNRQDSDDKMYAMAEKSYLNIDKRIRGTFQKKRYPLGGLELLEKDLTSYLSDMHDGVVISNHPSSLDRMLVHAICQYLKLVCKSHNCNGSRLMEIENHQNDFEPPQLLLSQYLRKKVLS